MTGDAVPATEAFDPSTAAIDALDDVALARTLTATHAAAVDACAAAAPAIAVATAICVRALEGGGRIVVTGAGTSGRLAVLDASELPPTFGLAPERWQGRIAGGDGALRAAIEGAEDDAEAGAASAADLRARDVLIGVSASGGAPFVRGAIRSARERGAATIAVVNVEGAPLAADAQYAVVVPTGGEAIAGSTRLRAGTAQKIVLNAISTGAMVRLGKTYGNRMVDVRATNAKLRARAERLVREFAGDRAAALLAAADGSVKIAIVMARRNVDRAAAAELLAAAGGRLRRVID